MSTDDPENLDWDDETVLDDDLDYPDADPTVVPRTRGTDRQPLSTSAKVTIAALVGLVGFGLVMSTMSSCSAPTVTTGQVPAPSVYVPPTPKSTTERAELAQAFITKAGTYGYSSSLTGWDAAMARIAAPGVAPFPLEGARYARCISEHCQVRVDAITPIPDSEEFTFDVTQTYTSTSGTTTGRDIWTVTVDEQGVVTRVTHAGLD